MESQINRIASTTGGATSVLPPVGAEDLERARSDLSLQDADGQMRVEHGLSEGAVGRLLHDDAPAGFDQRHRDGADGFEGAGGDDDVGGVEVVVQG